MRKVILIALATAAAFLLVANAMDRPGLQVASIWSRIFHSRVVVCPLPAVIPADRAQREQLNAKCSEGPNLASLFAPGEPLPNAMDPVTDPAIVHDVPSVVTPVYVGATGTISYAGRQGQREETHNQPLFADIEMVKAIVLANDMIAKAKNDPSARVHFVTEDPAIDRQNALGRTLWQGAHATGFTAGSRSIHVRTERAADIENWHDADVRTALRAVGIIRDGDHSKYMDLLDPDHHELDTSFIKKNDKLWNAREKALAGGH